jgi:hypothetical protein
LSSILDALNKLEKEESRQDYPLTRARAGGNVFTSKVAIGIIGVVCICLGVIGFGAYYRRSPEKTPELLLEIVRPRVTSEAQETPQPETNVLEQKHPPAPLPKTPVPLPYRSPDPKTMATAATASRPEILSTDNKTETKPKTSEGGNNKVEIEAKQIPAVESTEDPMEEAVVDTAIQDPKPQVVTKAKDTPASIADVSKEALVREEKPLPMDRLEGVSFKIQAISWGETPQERLVVISNQVLREGDGIEGYRISRINPDDIVLRRGANAYRLDFGLKGKP